MTYYFVVKRESKMPTNFFKRSNKPIETFSQRAEKDRVTLVNRNRNGNDANTEIHTRLMILDTKIKLAQGYDDVKWNNKMKLSHPKIYYRTIKRNYELKKEIKKELASVEKILPTENKNREETELQPFIPTKENKR